MRLHILLDYYIDQAEDAEGGDLNFISHYTSAFRGQPGFGVIHPLVYPRSPALRTFPCCFTPPWCGGCSPCISLTLRWGGRGWAGAGIRSNKSGPRDYATAQDGLFPGAKDPQVLAAQPRYAGLNPFPPELVM
jgi:hypothetical protein